MGEGLRCARAERQQATQELPLEAGSYRALELILWLLFTLM